jgi:hypothetical protein
MSLICKITTTTTISFGEDSGIGWRVAHSCILAGATLYTPFQFFLICYIPHLWDAVHGIGFLCCSGYGWSFLFRIYPLYALHLCRMPLVMGRQDT